jgi:ferredoxin-type protein NapH
VQSAVLLLFLVIGLIGFLSTLVLGEGIFFGSLSSSTALGVIVLTDPYAFLGAIAASKALPALALFVGALTIVVVYALIRGRVFCGWVCPLGLFVELANWIGDKTGLRKRTALARPLPRYSKIISAVAILLLSAVIGIPVFELVSPVAALPRLFVLGVALGIWVFLAIVLLELFFPGRLWCNGLCPVGGLYEAVGSVGFVGIRNHRGCTRCNRCKEVCLADDRILDEVIAGTKTAVSAGDCLICGKCVDVCPAGTLKWRFGPAFVQPAEKSLPARSRKPQGGR